MNDNAKAWVEALRSGEYEQTTRALHRGRYIDGVDKFCCLGVACDLAVKAGVIDPPFQITAGRYAYGQKDGSKNTSSLPRLVCEWLGVNDEYGSFTAGNDSLAALNDGGQTFEQIAAVIESEPSGLFRE